MALFNRVQCCACLLATVVMLFSVDVFASRQDEANKLLLSRDYKQAVPLFLDMARNKQADAQWRMAQFYRMGQGVKKDFKKSLYWLQQAAKSNHIKAMYQLGITYSRGVLVTEDKILVRNWLERAAKQGYSKAAKALDKLNASNNILPKNFKQLVKACKSGDLILLDTLKQDSLSMLSPQGYNLLWPVIRAHKFSVAKILLKRGVALNQRDQYGQTLLHDRVQAQDDAAIKWLIARGANASIQDSLGNTPLHLAVTIPLSYVGESLVKAALNSLEMTNQKGEAPLDRARANNQSGWVVLLKKYGAKSGMIAGQGEKFTNQALEKAAKKNRIPPLHWAAQTGNLAMVKRYFSLEKAHAQDRTEQTPLQRAVCAGHLPVVKWLTKKAGIDTALDSNLLSLSIQRQQVDIARYFARVVTDPKQLMAGFQAAMEQKMPKVSQVLFQKIQDTASPGQWLLELSRHYHFKLAAQVLGSAKDVSLEDSEGRTALWYSLSMGEWALSEQLLILGAKTIHTDHQGNSGLHVWMAQADRAGVERLYQMNVDLTRANREGLSPLALGVINNRLDAVKALLAIGVDQNTGDHFGNTALMLAVQGGHLDMVNALLSAGADKRLRNDNKQSALNMAKALGYAKITEALSKDNKTFLFF